MAREINITESVFNRLQKIAVPFEDTPSSVIETLLDFYERYKNDIIEKNNHQNVVIITNNKKMGKKEINEKLSKRLPRQRGVMLKIDDREFKAISIKDLYEQILKFIVDSNYIEKIETYLPIKTSNVRHLLHNKPSHPYGNAFVQPVKYKGYYMETNKDYKNGLSHLYKLLNICGLSIIDIDFH